MRIALFIVFLLLAGVCGFGLLSSFEPGTAMIWKIGYGLGAVAFLCAAALAAMMRRGDASGS